VPARLGPLLHDFGLVQLRREQFDHAAELWQRCTELAGPPTATGGRVLLTGPAERWYASMAGGHLARLDGADDRAAARYADARALLEAVEREERTSIGIDAAIAASLMAQGEVTDPATAGPLLREALGRAMRSGDQRLLALALDAVGELVAALGEIGIVSSRRMDLFVRPDGVTVIDDTYNANPSSTAAALNALATMRVDGRRVAVLGYMAELGDQEQAGHEEVGRLAAELGVDRLVAVADNARPFLDGANRVDGWAGEAVFAADQAPAVEIVKGDLKAGDIVLVKGSRYRTWDVVDALRPEEVRP